MERQREIRDEGELNQLLSFQIGEEVAVPSRRALAQLVGVRDLQVEPLDADLSEVGHAEKGTSGGLREPGMFP